jgi:hypothetical protein
MAQSKYLEDTFFKSGVVQTKTSLDVTPDTSFENKIKL